MAGTNPDTATTSSVFTSSAASAFLARRGSAPLSYRERYDWPPAPSSCTSDCLCSSHARPSSLRRDVTADFERRPHSSLRRDDTADSERLKRLETQLAELRADSGCRGHSVNYAAERPSDSSDDDDGAPLLVAFGAQLSSRRPPTIKMNVHCATTLLTSVALQCASKPRRCRPPDRDGLRSEEGRPTRTSIPARLAVRRGDRATA